MNKNTFKLVWSRHQKCLVPVGENCSLTGKSKNETTNVLGKVIAVTTMLPLISWATTLVPTPSVNGPTVTSSQNSQPIVNISQSNSAGLSVNQFNQMAVTNGLIINNSLVDGMSRTGGQVMKNPNLTTQSKAVLLQNVGTAAASLSGVFESFGKSVDLFVSSSKGLSINGVSTVNISTATYTTGVPVDTSKSKPIFAVNGGQLSVGASGINTGGLDYLALIARSINVAGPVTDGVGKADITLIAGANNYDGNTGNYGALTSIPAGTPQVGISGTDLGSMYGNNILLVSTESGVGVSHTGLITSKNDILINANGDVKVKQATAGANLSLTSAAAVTVGLSHGQDGLVAGQALTVNAGNAATFNNNATGTTVNVSANGVVLNNAVLKSTSTQDNNGMTIVSQGDVTMTGSLQVLDTNGVIVQNGTTAVIKGVLVPVNANTNAPIAGQISSTSGIYSANGLTIQTAGGVSNLTGVISADQNININSLGTILNTGLINSEHGSDNITSLSTNNLLAIYAKKDVSLTTASLNNGGGSAIFATEKMNVLLKNNAVNSGLLYADEVNITSSGNGTASLLNKESGNINAKHNLVVTTDGLTNIGSIASGDQETNGNATFTVTGNFDNLIGTGNSGVNISNTGSIFGYGDVTINAGNLTNTHSIQSKQYLQLNTKDLTNSDTGAIASQGDTLIQATNINNSGQFLITGNGKITAGNDFNNIGKSTGSQASAGIYANSLDVSAQNLSNTGNAYFETTGDLKISTAGLISNLDSLIKSDSGAVSLTPSGVFHNSGASASIEAATTTDIISKSGILNDTKAFIKSVGKLTLSGTSVVNDSGSLQTGNPDIVDKVDLSITATGPDGNQSAFENINAGTITATGGLAVNAVNGSLVNSNAKMQGVTNVTLNAQTIRNDAGGKVTAGNLSTTGDGKVLSVADMIVTATGSNSSQSAAISNSNSSVFTSTGNLVIEAKNGSISNTDHGALNSAGNLSLTAANGNITNSSAAQIAATQNISLTAETISNDAGSISTGVAYENNPVSGAGNLNIVATGLNRGNQSAVSNLNGGSLNSTGNLTISANNGGIVNAATAKIIGTTQLAITAQNGSINNAGALSTDNNLAITAINGDVSNTLGATAKASDTLTVNVQNGNINNFGSFSANKSASFTASKDFNNIGNGSGVGQSASVKGDTVSISSQNINNSNGAMLEATKLINLDSQVAINNTNSTIKSDEDAVKLTSSYSINNTGGGIVDGASAVTMSSNAIITNNTNSTIQSDGQIALTGSAIINDGATISAGARSNGDSVTQVGNLSITATGADQSQQSSISNLNNGMISATGDMLLSAQAGSITNSNHATMQGDGQLALNAFSSITNSSQAQIQGVKKVALVTSTLVNDSGTIQAGNANNSGSMVITASGVNTEQKAISNINSGSLIAFGDLTANAVNGIIDNNTSGKIQGAGQVTLVSTALINDNASLVASGTSVSGEIEAGNISITTASNGQNGGMNGVFSSNNGMISASSDLSITAMNGSINNSSKATLQGNSVELSTPGSILNSDASILASGALKASAAIINNSGTGLISAAQSELDATTLVNNSVINASDTLLMNTTSFTNTATGTVKATNEWTLNTDQYSNVAQVGAESSGKNATVTFKKNESVDLTNLNILPIADTLLTLNANNVQVDISVANPGSIQINAQGQVDNNQSVQSGINLGIDAKGDINNNTNAYLWALKNVVLTTPGTVNNSATASMDAGGDLSIDATTLNNNSIRSGSYQADTTLPPVSVTGRKLDMGTFGGTNYKVFIDNIVPLVSTLTLQRGSIHADGSILLNENAQKNKFSTINNSGEIVSGSDIHFNGNLNNISKTLELSLPDLLKTPTKIRLFSDRVDIGENSVAQSLEPTFKSISEMLDYLLTGDSTHKIWELYYSDSSELMHALAQAKTGKDTTSYVLERTLNAALGADWKSTDYSVLRSRWAVTSQNINAHGQSFYTDKPVVIDAGGKISQDPLSGSVNNGDATQNHENQTSSAKIGDKVLPTVTGAINASVNKISLVQSLSIFGDASVPTITVQFLLNGISVPIKMPVFTTNDLKSFLGNSHSFIINTLPSFVIGTRAPLKAPGTNVTASAVEPLIFPVYATSFSSIKQSDYFGTSYFFQSVGYNPGVPIATAFDNYTTTQDISRLVRTKLSRTEELTGSALVKNLMDNAGEVSVTLGLTIGVAPTDQQLALLTENIIWYVSAMLDGQSVLLPQIYLSPKAVAAENAALQGGGSMILAKDTISLSADKQGISNVNGLIHGGNGVSLRSAGGISNIADGGIAGGITSDKKVSLKADGDINNSGASISGKNVRIVSGGKITVTAAVGYGADGKVAIVNSGSISADGDSGRVVMKADKGIELTATSVNGNDISLDGGEGKVETKVLNLVTSDYKSAHQQGSDYSIDTTESKSSSTAAGTTLAAGVNGTLHIAGQGIVLNGGTYTGGTAMMDAKDGDLIIAASQDYSHETKDSSSTGFVQTGQFGYGDDSVGSRRSTLPGEGTSSTDYQNGANAGGSLGSASDSLEFKTTSTTTNAMTNKNASLSFGHGMLLKSNKTVDIGGADLTSDEKTGGIFIDAGDVATTKYVDTSSTTSSSSTISFGNNNEGHSSLKKVADDALEIKQKHDRGMTKDGNAIGVEVGTAVGDTTNVILGDTGGASTNVNFGSNKTKSTSSTTQENTTHLKAGTISIVSRKGNIDLKGVESFSNDLLLDSAGSINVSAAKGTSTSHTDSTDINLSVTGSASANAPTAQAGAAVSVGLSKNDSSSDSSDQTYTNSGMHASGKLTVKAKKDLNLVGAKLTGSVTDLDVDGNTTVTSVQDVSHSSSNSDGWNFSGGVAITTHGPTPIGGAGGTHKESKDNGTSTKEQSGIEGTQSLSGNLKGNVNLNGGHITSTTGKGDLTVAGTVTATDLIDHRSSSGFGYDGSAGVGTTGMPTVSAGYTLDDAITKTTVQHATIGVSNLHVAGPITGSLNRDASKLSVVTQDEHIAGSAMEISLGPVKPMGKKGSKKVAPEPVIPRPVTPEVVIPRPGTPEVVIPKAGTPKAGTPKEGTKKKDDPKKENPKNEEPTFKATKVKPGQKGDAVHMATEATKPIADAMKAFGMGKDLQEAFGSTAIAPVNKFVKPREFTGAKIPALKVLNKEGKIEIIPAKTIMTAKELADTYNGKIIIGDSVAIDGTYHGVKMNLTFKKRPGSENKIYKPGSSTQELTMSRPQYSISIDE